MGRNPETAFIENQMDVSGSFKKNALCFYHRIEIFQLPFPDHLHKYLITLPYLTINSSRLQ